MMPPMIQKLRSFASRRNFTSLANKIGPDETKFLADLGAVALVGLVLYPYRCYLVNKSNKEMEIEKEKMEERTKEMMKEMIKEKMKVEA